MRCNAVIAITVTSGTGNEELLAGADALNLRYSSMRVADQPVKFVNIVADQGNYLKCVFDTVSSESKVLQEILSNGGRIGLYWCVHGTVDETRPNIHDLASTTATLINDLDLRFAKINLSACYSAGKGEKGRFNDDDVRTSMVATFCKELAKQCKPQSIEGLMVAGYRAIIVMYHSPDKDLNPGVNKYFEQLKTAVPIQGAHNTFEISKQLHPTYPRDVTAQALENVAAIAPAVAKANPKMYQKLLDNKNTNKEIMNLRAAIEMYILSKLVFRYSAKTEQWTFVSISEYSDNVTVKQMVGSLEWNVRNSKLVATIDVPL